MDVRNEKGYILAIAIMFTIVTIITSFGLYSYVSNTFKRTGVIGVGKIKSYYLDIAAARYTQTLLSDPTNPIPSPTSFEIRNETGNPYKDFATNIGLQAPYHFNVTVEDGEETGSFNVTVRYETD